jgi:dTDP-4-amino-4,6-dideoxygalactose transaminase
MVHTRHVYHIYAIRTRERASLKHALTEQGIQSGIHYPFPVHLLGAYADLGYRPGDFPQAENMANEHLSLPMYPELQNEQIHQVAEAVAAACQGLRPGVPDGDP